MGDPFSTLASALQIAEVASGVGCRIVRFIRDLKDVDVTTEELFKKSEHLQEIVAAIERFMKRRHALSSDYVSEDEAKALSTTSSLLKSCGKDIDAFTKVLAPLKKGPKVRGIYRISAQARLDWNEKYIDQIGRRLHGNIMLLQTLSSCSEAVIQGDAMSRLAGNNDDIARNQERMQQDIARLRLAFETFSRRRLRDSNASSGLTLLPGDLDDIGSEEAILKRMRATIEVTESLCDKISTRDSFSDTSSDRNGLQRRYSNALTAEDDMERHGFMFVQSHPNTLDTTLSSLTTTDNGFDIIELNKSDSHDNPNVDCGNDDTKLKRVTSPRALPLCVMERMLENYQYQAALNTNGSTPQYEEAERDLLRALDCGAKREQVYSVAFEERFDIGIKLAKVQIEQRKYTATETTLDSVRRLVGQDQDKLERWSCASARLYQLWYGEARDFKLLSKLEEFSIQAYSVASQSKSSTSVMNQNLIDSAEALIAFYSWTGDKVAVDTMKQMHPSVGMTTSSPARQDLLDSPRTPTSPLPLLIHSSPLESSGLGISDSSYGRPNRIGSNLNEGMPNTDTESKLLLSAAKSKSADLVRYHVNRGDVNSRDERQRSPLHLALLGVGGKDVVRILLENGADVNVVDISGTSLLHICADLDKDDMARELIGRGAELNAVDVRGETPLHIAVRKRRLRMVQCLLNAGAAVENVCRQSGYKEIDFVIQEYLDIPPTRGGSGVGRFFRRP